MFFGLDIPFILNDLEYKEKLRKYFNISEVLSADQVYKNFSNQNSEKLVKALNRIINSRNCVKRRGKRLSLLMQHQWTWILISIEIKRLKKS